MTPGDLLARMTGGRGGNAHAARSACSRLFRQGKASAREVGPEAGADAGFVEDILRDPAADAPRMAYADWLTERDDPRGEFVAAQLELAALEAAGAGAGVSPLLDVEYAGLKRRERELLETHWHDWLAEGGMSRYFATNRDGEGYGWLIKPVGEDGRLIRCSFRRGFIAHVTLTLADFEAHAAALFGAAPIEGVRLADKQPYHTFAGWWGWGDESDDERTVGSPGYLPRYLFDLLPEPDVIAPPVGGYHTEARAFVALSVACVAHGRRLAGRPALPGKEAARA
jgi:uncharacterized protein (TIGR02996 family)